VWPSGRAVAFQATYTGSTPVTRSNSLQLAAMLRGQSSVSPRPKPELFAPGMISGPGNDGSPTFSPDGNTLFFTRSTSHWTIILESHKRDGRWSRPTVAPFSGEWPESSPAMSSDGSYIVFQTSRGGVAPPFSDGKHLDVDPEIAPDESFLVFSSAGRMDGDAKDHLFILRGELNRKNAENDARQGH
jgi:Tol biopolymer transport system component